MSTLPTRPLGTGGPTVTRLGLGLAALGRPGYMTLGHAEDLERNYAPAEMEARCHAVLDAAWAEGVRYIDTARSYGRAEEFLSWWLAARGHKPGNVVVASKWGYTYMANWRAEAPVHEVKDHGFATLLRQWPESKAWLKGHLAVYQIHSVSPESGVLRDAAVLGALARMRADSGVRIGLTVTGPKQGETIETALEVRFDGVRLFDVVQATWNLLERAAGPALARAHDAGVGIIIKEGLANGRLGPRNDSPSFAPTRARLEAQAERLTTSIDALALAAVLAQPWADVVLSGAATVPHLRSNLRAAEVVWDEAAENGLARTIEAPEEYWRKRASLPWV